MCVSVQLNTEPHPTPRHHDAVEPLHDCAPELQVAHTLVVSFPLALERTTLLLGQFHDVSLLEKRTSENETKKK
jgi:hypothetical protein